MDAVEQELKQLHLTLERMGKNSTTTTDIFGRRFQVPVDAEHKATQDPLSVTLCNFSNPHMRGTRDAPTPPASPDRHRARVAAPPLRPCALSPTAR